MSVDIRHVSKFYGKQKAVDNISFKAGRGDILGFLGPNGAGKSTTMKMITGYIPVSSGEILVGETDIKSDPISVRRRIGYLPENNPLYLDMYVREYLSFICSVHKIKDKKTAIRRVVEMTGLGHEQHKKIHQLSKGYRQRTGLAQALIHDPDILILDEPTTGLDPNQLEEIRSLIKTLGQSKTIIFSTHIMQEVQAVCNRVIIIQKGKLVADNTVEGLSGQISGAHAIRFTLERPIKTDLFKKFKFISSVENTGKSSYQMYGSDSFRMKKTLFETVVNQENTILELYDVISNLEDTFKLLTHQQSE